MNMTSGSEGWHFWDEKEGKQTTDLIQVTTQGALAWATHSNMFLPTWYCPQWWSSGCWCLDCRCWNQCCSVQCCPGSFQSCLGIWWWLLCSTRHLEKHLKLTKCKKGKKKKGNLRNTAHTFSASHGPSPASMSAVRVSTVVMFHLEMSSSDATRDTDPSSWTLLSETPVGNT